MCGGKAQLPLSILLHLSHIHLYQLNLAEPSFCFTERKHILFISTDADEKVNEQNVAYQIIIYELNR